jgi:xylulokinase
MKYIIALDIGTTAVKAAVFNEKLQPQCYAIEEYTLQTPQSGYVELNPTIYWDHTVAAVHKLLQESQIDPQNILSITCTTQGETLIPIDCDGKPLYHAVVWLDSRASSQAREISQTISPLEFYQKTGLPELNGYCPIAKLKWFADEKPELYQKTEKFLLLEDYLIFCLTGRYVTNTGLVSSTGYFDIKSGTYWTEILNLCGVDVNKLAEVYPCGTPVAVLSKEAAAELGLSEKTMVTTGAMDQLSSAVGAGNIHDNDITETTGTCQFIALTCTDPQMDTLSPVTVYNHAVSGKYLKIMMSQTAGIVYKWFRNEFCDALVEKLGEDGAFARMDELAQAEPAGSRGVLMYPHLTGVQVPYSNDAMRGAFLGIGLDTPKGCFIRAIMEGVGYMLKECIELMGVKPQKILSLGGGAKSSLWCQIKSDICDWDIVTLCQEESTLLGAAILGAVATGLYPSLEQAVSVVEYRKIYHPQQQAIKQYQTGYAAYQQLYAALSPIYELMRGRNNHEE